MSKSAAAVSARLCCAVAWNAMNISFLLLGRTSALARCGGFQLHAARAERFANEAFDLRVDAPELGRSAALDRRPQRGVDSERIGLAVGVRHDAVTDRVCRC